MDDLAALVLADILLPGLVAGFAAAVLRRRSWTGIGANLILGAIGGVAGGLLAVGVGQKLQLPLASLDGWPTWLGAIAGSLLLITLLRGMATALVDATEEPA